MQPKVAFANATRPTDRATAVLLPTPTQQGLLLLPPFVAHLGIHEAEGGFGAHIVFIASSGGSVETKNGIMGV